jgi:IS30 family transposase
MSLSREGDSPDKQKRGVALPLNPRCHSRRKKKTEGRKPRKTKIPNRISIEERPVSVDSREEFGHWEWDSLVSKKSLAALNSLVERKSQKNLDDGQWHRERRT